MTGEQRDDWCPHEELAVGFAMHALEPAEEARLRAHLPGCERCRQAVRSTEEVTATLGASVHQHEPPERLRSRLMAAIDETPQEVARRQPVAEPIPSASRRRGAGWARKALVAAAALIVATVVGIGGVRLDRLNDQVAQQSTRTEQLERALRLAADPDTDRAVLRTDSGDPLAVLLSGEDKDAVVMPMNLKSNDTSQQIYVVWGTTTTPAVALATFDVSAGDPDLRLLKWSPDAHKHNGFAISLEPGRQAPQTPSDIVALGQVGTA